MQQQYAKPVYYWEKDPKPVAQTIHNVQRPPAQQQSQSKPACAPILLYHEQDKPPVQSAVATNASPTSRQQRISSLLDRLEAELDLR
jgi:hypothetical protein